jgi:serine/threonine protein kinase
MTSRANAARQAAPVSRSARYELRQLLGRGGSGTVHEAWDIELQRRVAIKRIPLGEGGDALAEARLAADLRHPAFVAVHEVFDEDGIAERNAIFQRCEMMGEAGLTIRNPLVRKAAFAELRRLREVAVRGPAVMRSC